MKSTEYVKEITVRVDSSDADTVLRKIEVDGTYDEKQHLLPLWRSLEELANILPPNPPPLTKQPAGRNEPCPCGSGIKYKRCCRE